MNPAHAAYPRATVSISGEKTARTIHGQFHHTVELDSTTAAAHSYEAWGDKQWRGLFGNPHTSPLDESDFKKCEEYHNALNAKSPVQESAA